MQDGLEVVPFSRILRIEQLQHADHEFLVHILLGSFGISVIGDYVAKQELIDNLHGSGSVEARTTGSDDDCLQTSIKTGKSSLEGSCRLGGPPARQVPIFGDMSNCVLLERRPQLGSVDIAYTGITENTPEAHL